MKRIYRIATAVVFLAVAVPAALPAKETRSVKIVAPANNAELDTNKEYQLTYEGMPGAEGDRFQVWVDSEKGPSIRAVKATYPLPKLSPGQHVLTIRVLDAQDLPTGAEKSVTVNAKPGTNQPPAEMLRRERRKEFNPD